MDLERQAGSSDGMNSSWWVAHFKSGSQRWCAQPQRRPIEAALNLEISGRS